MATVLTGKVDDNTILSDEKMIDITNEFAMLDPNVSQFTTMLQQLNSAPAKATKVEWLEDEYFPRLATQSGGATSGATTVNVTTGQGAYFKAGNVVRNARTGEAIVVSSVSTDALTVTRGLGSVAAAAMLDADQLVIIGSANMQGAGLPTRKVLKRVMNYNYTQIQRDSYGFTNSLIETDLWGGNEPGVERRKKAVEHKRAIENTLFWGARSLDTGGTNPVGYCGGLVEFVSTNVRNVGGTLTKTLLDGYLRDALQHGNQGSKVLFAGPVVAAALSGFLRDAWQPIDTSARLFGAKVDGVISGAYGGKVPVVVKNDWNDFSTASTQYGGWAFLVDMDYVKWRPMQNRNTKLLTGRQANDADGLDEEYLTEHTLQIMQERTHMVIKGVTG